MYNIFKILRFCSNSGMVLKLPPRLGTCPLLYSNHIYTFLHYFSCVTQVSTKYRLSFKLSQCDFFLPRVEYVGYYLICDGNYPAQSKFHLINKQYLPLHCVSLLSFIRLCAFYRNYIKWFESNIKPLRCLQYLNHCLSLPIFSWSPPLVELFK